MKLLDKYKWVISFSIAIAVSGRVFHLQFCYYVAVGVFLLAVSFPVIRKFISLTWGGFVEAIGSLILKLMLSFLFFLMITPLAILKNISKKKTAENLTSNFIVKEHHFQKEEFEKTW